MHEHPDIVDLMPPGTYLEKIHHPDESASKMLELAIFKEHRFSFYFWNRWVQKNERTDQPPTLVTIDWHRDLAPPSKSEQEMLDQLNISDLDQVAKFAWSELDSHNDGHLLSAAYLNLVGDVFLLKNYGRHQVSSYKDRYSKVHKIHEFSSYNFFEEAVTLAKDTCFILDIDLDYFIKDKVTSHQLKEVTPYSNNEIAAIINNKSKLFEYLHPNLLGLSIATEPRYCGGIIKSNHILEVVMNGLFTKDLRWKHLRSEEKI